MIFEALQSELFRIINFQGSKIQKKPVIQPSNGPIIDALESYSRLSYQPEVASSVPKKNFAISLTSYRKVIF